jgi:hypothetical protein
MANTCTQRWERETPGMLQQLCGSWFDEEVQRTMILGNERIEYQATRVQTQAPIRHILKQKGLRKLKPKPPSYIRLSLSLTLNRYRGLALVAAGSIPRALRSIPLRSIPSMPSIPASKGSAAGFFFFVRK